jgi:hypothetical protein
MELSIDCPWQFASELHREPGARGIPLSSEDATGHVLELMDEAFVGGILADALPQRPERLHVQVEPMFSRESIVDRIEMRLDARCNGSAAEYRARLSGGRWSRTWYQRLLQLREEGTLAKDESAYQALTALPAKGPQAEPPLIQAPPIIDGTLEQFGVVDLGTGELVPDRPILINQRLETDSVAACLAGGGRETGAAALGVLLRLPEPLPGTSTRIVTLLTTCIEDRRHSGQVNEWSISPDALAESAQIADLRGFGETVITVIHSHGWSSECGKCNENANCPLAECTHVSLMDYQVLETLFPGRATVMPIVGRKLGAEGQQPVLAIHAWRGGEMRPLRFQRYLD